MSTIAGVGILAVSIWNPIIGNWIDAGRQSAEALNLNGAAAEVAAGQATLSKLLYFPVSLVVLFGLLWLITKSRKSQS